MPAPKKKQPRAIPTSMEALNGNLQKRYGSRAVRREDVVRYDCISTGSLTLDAATRVGGWPRGRICELVGPEGSGKTTIDIGSMVAAQAHVPDRAVAYIDMEQSFDYAWAEAQGLDTSAQRFIHVQPDHAEDVSDMLRQTIETGLFSFVSVDSIGAMESMQALEKDAEEHVMGRNAQVITRMVKNCAVLARRNNTAVLLVNQLRANLSGMGSDISAGPKAMKYSTTIKVETAHAFEEPIRYRIPGDVEDSIIGRMIRARCTRNKVAVQGKKAEFYIINYDTPEYGPVGIDKADEAVNVGVQFDVIEQRGSHYYMPNATNPDKPVHVNGKEKAVTHLRSCPDDLNLIRTQVINALAGDVHEETEVEFEMEPA